MGHRGHVPPTFTNGRARRGMVSRRTANKKLTKLYWPSRKRSRKRQIVLLEPKKWRGTTKKFSPALRAGRVPPPTFKFVPAPLPRIAIKIMIWLTIDVIGKAVIVIQSLMSVEPASHDAVCAMRQCPPYMATPKWSHAPTVNRPPRQAILTIDRLLPAR